MFSQIFKLIPYFKKKKGKKTIRASKEDNKDYCSCEQ